MLKERLGISALGTVKIKRRQKQMLHNSKTTSNQGVIKSLILSEKERGEKSLWMAHSGIPLTKSNTSLPLNAVTGLMKGYLIVHIHKYAGKNQSTQKFAIF